MYFIHLFLGEDGESKEKNNIALEKEEVKDEIDPLDAYMQEVQQASVL